MPVRHEFLVSPNGRRSGDGSRKAPFHALEAARTAIRAIKRDAGLPHGGITVRIAPGIQPRQTTFRLDARDSGTAQAPIRYTGHGSGTSRLDGGLDIPADAWAPASAARTEAVRLMPAARDHVQHVDLAVLGMTDFGHPTELGAYPMLTVDDAPMTLARWPNRDFAVIETVCGGDPISAHGLHGDRRGVFTLPDRERLKRWRREADLWLHGYWFWDWSAAWMKVASIDPTRRRIHLAPPDHGYGYRAGQRFYAANALCELDTPGEWYIDRDRGRLWFWPPRPLAGRRTVITRLATPLLSMQRVQHVEFRNLTFAAVRETAVEIQGGAHATLRNCTVRNTGRHGVRIQDGLRHTVRDGTICHTGAAGVMLAGGNRRTLTPAGHAASNNHIHHFGQWQRTYAGAIHLSGVGNQATGNVIHDAPHMAIFFDGNEQRMERNRITAVCLETGDVGVFYTGRDWTVRGHLIRHNYIHDVHGPGLWGAQVIYLDDAASGITVTGNLIVRCARAMLIGGGRDNRIENNCIIDCQESIRIDNRGLNWMHATVAPNGIMHQRLDAMPTNRPPWSRRYPQLLTLRDDQPPCPKGNIVRRNVIWRSPDMILAPDVVMHGTIRDNLATDLPLDIGDPKRHRYNFNKTNDLATRIPGWQPIPFQRIACRR